MKYSLEIGNCVINASPVANYTGKIGIVDSIDNVYTYKSQTLFSIRTKTSQDAPEVSIAAYDSDAYPILLSDHVLEQLGFTYNPENQLFESNSLYIATEKGSIRRTTNGGFVYKRDLYVILDKPNGKPEYVGFVNDIQNYSVKTLGVDILAEIVKSLVGIDGAEFQGRKPRPFALSKENGN